ncbi:MAG: NAD(P)/FAD-dependent oxidoreductase [Pseudomonadales bacterium]|nr:NAD(P)/FAD-dependent oxidoreductase [Pseudomonadales bacterium]MCP5182570.1 NAD(P)/FAD-dependent oxidoreductase [Pseudomonadales bacterium]
MQQHDVVIVGAGLSGIGAAVHLETSCPGKQYTILEARDAIGGTWDLFRYPGIRSDSDMHTLGYDFKPWREAKAIADGPSIRRYVRETASEYGVDRHIQYGRRLKSAAWDTPTACWRLSVENVTSGERETITCNFLLMCSGYYSYQQAYVPEIEGLRDFAGTTVLPQFWPEDLDYGGKRVVVIGSGATAMTVVPSMADKASHVTMVQRSPTYVVSRPDKDAIANFLRRILPEKLAYRMTRFKNTHMQRLIYNRSRVAPDRVRDTLLKEVRGHLGPHYDVDRHFTPRYNPWDQRLCLIPNGDLFDAINRGKVDVVTGEIERITAGGVTMRDGTQVEADVLVLATGLVMELLGGATFEVDGRQVDFPNTVSYRAMMYADVPNMVQTFGYINASWTLRADLTADYVCRVLNHMDKLGVRQVTPRLRPEERNLPRRPWIEDFSAGYMRRVMHLFPKQLGVDPWRNTQNYALDRRALRNDPLEDGALIFGAGELAAAQDNLATESAAVSAG